jgi:putative hydroxymethylpyrimidine transporter CytX
MLAFLFFDRMSLIKPPPEWGVEPVPKEKKVLGFLDFFIFWLSLAVGLLVLQAGASLAQDLGLSFGYIIIVSALGSLIGSLILAFVGMIGSKYGVPTMVSLRPSFGLKGSYLPTSLNVVQLIGWTTFELIIMGEAATTVTGEIFGYFTRPIMISIFAIWCYLLMIGGPLVVIKQWLEKIAIWISTITAIWLTYLVFTKPIVWQLGNFDLSKMPLALDLVIAMPISWLPLISDYNRFASSEKRGFLGTLLGYILANTWFYVLGAGLWFTSAGGSVVYSIALLALGNLALVALLVDETDNAFADIYSSTVSIQNIMSKIRQWKLGLIIVLVSLGLALTVQIGQYVNFLLLIGASFIPIFGVLSADYLVVRKKKYIVEDFYSGKPSINKVAIVSWILGFVSYYFFSYVFIIGGTLSSFLIAFISYVLLKKGDKT